MAPYSTLKRFIVLCLLLLPTASAFSQVNSWSQKALFPLAGRRFATAFGIGNRGYVACGNDGTNIYQDLWEYDQATNAWSQKANLGGAARAAAVSFVLNGLGYVATGGVANGAFANSLWEYSPAANQWTQRAPLVGDARELAVAFSANGRGYIGTGHGPGGYYRDLWEWNPATNAWAQKANFIGAFRQAATAFALNNRGYVGLGNDGSFYYRDFFEYDPASNAWTQKASFGGSARTGAVGFALGNLGYIGTGYTGGGVSGDRADFWEYNATADQWTQKANYGGAARGSAAGFVAGNRGYILQGVSGTQLYRDMWEYYAIVSSVRDGKPTIEASLYPNPAREAITLTLPAGVATAEVVLLDQTGKIVLRTTARSQDRLDISNLATGLYTARIEAATGQATHKILVTK